MPWAEQQRRQLLEHPLCAQAAPAIPTAQGGRWYCLWSKVTGLGLLLAPKP